MDLSRIAIVSVRRYFRSCWGFDVTLEQRQAAMRSRQAARRDVIGVLTPAKLMPQPVAAAIQSRWLSVPEVAAELGWSRSHATRHLERLLQAGHPGVINSALGRKRMLQISREALDELLVGMSGSVFERPMAGSPPG